MPTLESEVALSLNQQEIRVVIADDSAVMRGVLRTLFAQCASRHAGTGIELCGVARDGVECLQQVRHERPDVLVLDLEMPRLHGLEVVTQLHREQPRLPILICSAYTVRGARCTIEALARGASDYVTKPAESLESAQAMELLAQELLPRILSLAGRHTRTTVATGRRLAAEVSTARRVDVVAIGVSTGGPSALERVLPGLPADLPVPVLIAQHMPRLFTSVLAERLNAKCKLRVCQAEDGAIVTPGSILLAPGDMHMTVRRESAEPGAVCRIHLSHDTAGLPFQPSADLLFHSVAQTYESGALGLVMTGMGSDGLEGARHIHKQGGIVLAQDQASSVVWGMPGRVVQAGLTDTPIPLNEIARVVAECVISSRQGNGSSVRSSGAQSYAADLSLEMPYGVL
ncbi:MAG: chemotaxis-specific protein-glutamate methyltransferase CheB [Acidobacteriota bacterium]|nr:chemotaxis-specific protein-glutamate methyltransferase CheB [Acidobacteriota bacterium]